MYMSLKCTRYSYTKYDALDELSDTHLLLLLLELFPMNCMAMSNEDDFREESTIRQGESIEEDP